MKQSFETFWKFSVFLISGVVIFYLLPRQGQFKYEYQENKPWNHGLVVAPFDFPMLKTDKELKSERDSLLAMYKPYYQVDLSVFSTFKTQLNKNLTKEWPSFQQKYHLDDSLALLYNENIETIAFNIYNNGVMSPSDVNDLLKNKIREIVIVRSDFSMTIAVKDLMTPRAAYEAMMTSSKEVQQLTGLEELLRAVDVNNYLYSNLEYNESLSAKVKEELLTSISLTSGMIQTGERIIDKGEVVGAETFKKLESFKKEYKIRLGTSKQRKYLIVGQVALISVFMFMLFFFFYTYRKDTLQGTKDTIFIFLNIIMFIAMTAVISRFFVSLELYIIPFSILAICLHTFFDSRIAIFVNMITVFICSFYAESPFDFTILHILAGTVATYSVRNLNRRGQVFSTAAMVFVTYSVVYFALSLIQEGNWSAINYVNFIYFAANAVLLLFTYPLMFVYEKVFHYLSNVTLIELSDTNHELLQELSEQAPGTFQHSIMVANLAQQAAKGIGADPLLVKVGAYYHDIGKVIDPTYFTENQAGNYNPHRQLKPEESAKKIINHVEDGVRLARKHNIPQPVIDFIRMHHGRGFTKFFLFEYKKNNPDIEIDDQQFMYPGPSPMTKETAVLMMADSVEAASRSLSEYTEESISNLVDNIIDTQLREGNFKYAPITFIDIETVKEIFKKKLKIIYHTRVAYPKDPSASDDKS